MKLLVNVATEGEEGGVLSPVGWAGMKKGLHEGAAIWGKLAGCSIIGESSYSNSNFS
jgi:hypothetical protein